MEALMKIAAFVLLAINAFIWCGLTVFGVAYLLDRILTAHYHPSAWGVAWLIGIPLVALALVVRIGVKLRRDASALFGVNIFITISTLIVGVVYLMPLGGGM
jgi:hypothetical protein